MNDPFFRLTIRNRNWKVLDQARKLKPYSAMNGMYNGQTLRSFGMEFVAKYVHEQVAQQAQQASKQQQAQKQAGAVPFVVEVLARKQQVEQCSKV